jgi:hypothetical protein
MEIKAVLPPKERDLRLDLLRGFANWAIFLNHMPNNVVNWITTRNYGFSDGADLFVFISGYTAALVFGRMMRDYGFLIGATRLFRRVWQLYLAHMVLFVVYVAAVGYFALRFSFDAILHEYNVARMIDKPFETLIESLLLRFKPLNLDVLPLYIVLMALFPFVLWIMLRRPSLTILGSLALYLAARRFGWNFAAYPEGGWFFNPFCWQLLFCLGAWAALGGRIWVGPVIEARWIVYLGFAYLVFALVLTLAGAFPRPARVHSRRALRRLPSQRQNELGPVSGAAFRRPRAACDTLPSERLERTEMADNRSAHQMRRAVASRVLCRGNLVVSGLLPAVDQLRNAPHSIGHQRCRHRHSLRRCLL